MAINTTGLAALLLPDYKRVYVERGKRRNPEYSQFLNIEQLEWRNEKEFQISGLGALRSKPEAEQFPLDQPITGGTKTYDAEPFGLAVELSFEMVDDDLYGIMDQLVAGLRDASDFKLEVSGHKVLNNAFSTSFTGFTASESLCSTSHTLLNGSTLANRPTTDIELSVAAVQAAILRFHVLTDHRGIPRVMRPTNWIIDPNNLFVAREILGSGGAPYSANNEINSLVPEEFSFMVDHYLSVNTYWFVTAAKGEHDLNMRMRNAPRFDMFDDRRNMTAVATVYQRHGDSTFGEWAGVDGSTGA